MPIYARPRLVWVCQSVTALSSFSSAIWRWICDAKVLIVWLCHDEQRWHIRVLHIEWGSAAILWQRCKLVLKRDAACRAETSKVELAENKNLLMWKYLSFTWQLGHIDWSPRTVSQSTGPPILIQSTGPDNQSTGPLNAHPIPIWSTSPYKQVNWSPPTNRLGPDYVL